MSKKTLVLGASPNPNRYSHMAVSRLRAYGHPVVAIGLRPGTISDVNIQQDFADDGDIDTVTLYMNSEKQRTYYDLLEKINPGRIIFNPGAENDELYEMALQKGWEPIEACTLVMLSTGQY